jgi:hypothetical protein
MVNADLDNHLHKVLLRNYIFAIDNLFENTREDSLLIHAEINAVELTEADEIGADKDSQLFALKFPFLAVS